MRPTTIRSKLLSSACIDVADPSGGSWRIVVVRTGDWDGSPAARNYPLMWLVYRAWRWLRQIRSWDVAVGRTPGLWHRQYKIVATLPTHDLAVERAVEIIGHIETGTSW